MSTLSIAMATYNGEKYLLEQLQSLALQTILPDELVITDDQSSDGTLGLIAEFTRSAPFPVRLYRNAQRLGFKANFIKAASLCTCDLIAFCDQDDIWFPNKIETIISVFDDQKVWLAHHDSIVINDRKIPIGTLRPLHIPYYTARHESDPWFTAYGNTMFFRRALTTLAPLWHNSITTHANATDIATLPPQPESHDCWFYFLASHFGDIIYFDTPLIYYRQHGNNAAGWGGKMTYLRTWRHRLEQRHRVYDLCFKVALSRAEILSEVARCYNSFDRSMCLEGSNRYRELAHLYELRTKTYSSHNMLVRLANYLRLVRSNAYGKSGYWTFHFKGAVKDAALGMLLSNFVQKFGFPANGNDPTCSAIRHRSSTRCV